MISLSLGRCSRRCCWARGTSTVRPCAAWMRRSRSARCASRLARRARSSVSSRAARIAAVCRAYTTQVVTRNATSQTATQWRPLATVRHLERPQPRRAGARIVGQLRRRGSERLAREHAAQRPPATGAHGLARGADARLAPAAKRVLADAVLARVGRDHGEPAAGDERGPERRQRQVELLELLVHHDAQRLKQAGGRERTANLRTP